LVGKPYGKRQLGRGRDNLEDLVLDGKIIIEEILGK
jgi:hypothetical protein